MAALPEEPRHDLGGVVDWKSYLHTVIGTLSDSVKVNLKLRDRAVKLSIKELERRLEHLNGEQQRTHQERQSFVTNEAIDPKLHALEERMNKLELAQVGLVTRNTFEDYRGSQADAKLLLATALTEMKGRMLSQAALISFIISLVGGIVIGLVVKWLGR